MSSSTHDSIAPLADRPPPPTVEATQPLEVVEPRLTRKQARVERKQTKARAHATKALRRDEILHAQVGVKKELADLKALKLESKVIRRDSRHPLVRGSLKRAKSLLKWAGVVALTPTGLGLPVAAA